MQYAVREAGKNGTVEVLPDRIVRTFKKRLGKDDVQTIPVRGVTGVHHDRKRVGADVVTVSVGPTTYIWKTGQASALVDEMNRAIYA